MTAPLTPHEQAVLAAARDYAHKAAEHRAAFDAAPLGNSKAELAARHARNDAAKALHRAAEALEEE